jgi:transposase
MVVMEACAGAHHMARKLVSFGHRVKLISPQFVRPFVKSNKNDFVDAEALCEAASRPAMRFVTPKTESQQTLSALHRVRDSLVHDRVKAVNQMHGFLLEFGVSLPIGNAVIKRLPAVLAEHSLPPGIVAILERLHVHFKYLSEQIGEIDKESRVARYTPRRSAHGPADLCRVRIPAGGRAAGNAIPRRSARAFA